MFHTWLTRRIKELESSSGNQNFDGARPIKGTPSIGDNPNTSSIADFMESVFYPFLAALISINSGTSYFEKGISQNISISGNITANDETIFSNARIERSTGGVIPLTAQAGAYAQNDNGIIANVDYVSKVDVGGNGTAQTILSATKRIRFIYASYFGKNSTGLTPTAIEIKAGTKRIVLTTSYFNNNPNTSGSEYGWFAVPHTQTAKIYTTWFVVVGNDGAIGSDQFIKSPVIVAVDGVDYDVYVYGYPSELNANLKLS